MAAEVCLGLQTYSVGSVIQGPPQLPRLVQQGLGDPLNEGAVAGQGHLQCSNPQPALKRFPVKRLYPGC